MKKYIFSLSKNANWLAQDLPAGRTRVLASKTAPEMGKYKKCKNNAKYIRKTHEINAKKCGSGAATFFQQFGKGKDAQRGNILGAGHFAESGRTFYDVTELSKLRIPTISLVFGSSTAGGAYQPSGRNR